MGKTFKLSIFPSQNFHIFKDYLEELYPSNSKEGIKIMLNYLLRTRCQQDTISMTPHAQNFKNTRCWSQNFHPISLPNKRHLICSRRVTTQQLMEENSNYTKLFNGNRLSRRSHLHNGTHKKLQDSQYVSTITLI